MLSWKGTSVLLLELRHREAPFDNGQVQEAVSAARACGHKAPEVVGFDYPNKKDVFYRLLMPRLEEVLGNELAQAGDEDGFELFRQLIRKFGPPMADVAVDMRAEIEGLGKLVCSNFGQTARFLAMLNTRVCATTPWRPASLSHSARWPR